MIEYKKGRKNKVVDVLSKRGDLDEETEGIMALISFPTSDWLAELK